MKINELDCWDGYKKSVVNESPTPGFDMINTVRIVPYICMPGYTWRL